MGTYLLTWNPTLPDTDRAHFRGLVEKCQREGFVEESWSCGVNKNINAGDKVFLIRLGGEIGGLVGAGEVLVASHLEPHWQPQRKLAGEQCWMVTVRFTSLFVDPLINRLELLAPLYGSSKFPRRWSPQASGTVLEGEVAASAQKLYNDRLMLAQTANGDFDATLVARWNQYRVLAAANPEFSERPSDITVERAKVASEGQALLDDFCAGKIDLSTLRQIYHQKASKEWRALPLKGFSGAMVLNQLQKHLGQMQDLTPLLRRILKAPESAQDASLKGNELITYCAGAIASRKVAKKNLDVARLPVFLSGCWHLQRPHQWPLYLKDTSSLLRADGLLVAAAQDNGIAAYLNFCQQVERVRQAISVDFWQLQDLAAALMSHEEDVRKKAIPAAQASLAADRIDKGAGKKAAVDAALLAVGARPGASIWVVAPGPGGKWMQQCLTEEIVCLGWSVLGDLTNYDCYESFLAALQTRGMNKSRPTNNARACQEFVRSMQKGDLVLAKKGRSRIMGWGLVTSDYRYAVDSTNRPGYPNVRSVAWNLKSTRDPWRGELSLAVKTLTRINDYADLVAEIFEHFGLLAEYDVSWEGDSTEAQSYGRVELKRDLFIEEKAADEAYELITARKNVILQGPPGVGKSFLARKLAFALIGKQPSSGGSLHQLEFVQFHQSFTYEHFVRGYRPGGDKGFVLQDGLFLQFCARAKAEPTLPFVLIIDEINRGNLSRIFGELLMLIEADKRKAEWGVRLAYEQNDDDSLAQRFFVPSNLYIIGTMNTADRALVLPDYALRRRFAFLSIEPGFSHPRFKDALSASGVGEKVIQHIVCQLGKLNEEIERDPDLGKGFCIGHSYFCGKSGLDRAAMSDVAWFNRIMKTEIIRLLEEYWFDKKNKHKDFARNLLLPIP